ncbi:PREDICTED: uncharacterized protein LOC108359099 [Rhagoletis zephyria]|uniref:uncharacterized protein LOC108359099 n=1 Tax=Rhagoletis zephyria TaxID=28612 RepID=UPI000811A0F6|nr:PREDICTED: uncharacterized protein LOC108359099 [Rhagoletis zephyria]
MPMMQHGASYEICQKLSTIKDTDCQLGSQADRMQLIRNNIMKEWKLAHERSMKTYNTRSKEVTFKIGQVVYRKNFKQSSQPEAYNAKLGPNQIKCIVLKPIGNTMYERGDTSGKKVGVYHAKDIFLA